MSQLKIWDATANNNQGAWVPAVVGAAGLQGPVGPGVPAGGDNGTVLTKVGTGSGTDYQTSWQAVTTGVSSVDTLTGAVSLTNNYDAKGTAALKSKFDAFLAKTTGPTNAFPAANTVNPAATLTYSTIAVSTAVVWAWNSTPSKFYFRGLVQSEFMVGSTSCVRNNPVGDLSFNVFWVEFDHYGTQFDIQFNRRINTQYPQLWVWVDGVPVTDKPTYNNPTSNVISYQTVALSGDVKQRRIRVMLAAADFAGIGLASDKDTIFPVEQKLLKVVLFGGSWFQGGSGYPSGSIAYMNEHLSVQLGEMMNVDYYVNAIGGTGYYGGSAASPPNNWATTSRLNPLNTIQPDLIIFFGTTNDDYYTSTPVSTAATSTYNQVLAALPNTKIIVVTRQSNTDDGKGDTNQYPGALVNENAVVASATPFLTKNIIGIVKPFSEGWVNGTPGSSGTGNGSIYIYTDKHPTPIGNRYYATRTFNRVVDIIKTYTRS